MSTWRDSLLPASFRGVGFFIEKAVVPAGRKGQLHEFPQRDEPYFESLGKQSKVHTLTGFIVGPDCFEQRDRHWSRKVPASWCIRGWVVCRSRLASAASHTT